jgi:Xaa-Pro aminopeptidase
VAVVLSDRAALFIDGRYTLQATQQTDTALYEQRHLIELPPHKWLAANLPTGARIGYDPWLHTPSGVDQLRHACEKAGATLVACEESPLDAIWTDRPAPPLSPAVPHPASFSGRSSEQKRADLAEALAAEGLDGAVLSSPESIAWLLNVRGGDVPCTPLALSFALLSRDGTVDLLIDQRKLAAETLQHLGNSVRVAPSDALGRILDQQSGKKIRLDQATVPDWVRDRLVRASAEADVGMDPCSLPRACKNAIELSGMRAAHRRDGAALTRFLAWVSATAPGGDVTELSAAEHADRFRRTGEHYREPSFGTISAAGPNAALPHYHATLDSNRRLAAGELYLVDSGGQYLDGTTDVTRTIAVGPAGEEERHRFTLVLKGHIAIARCRFPKGTTGSQIDCLARLALWAEGLDYDHGTGHGVGSYLSVHEGPQRIAKVPNSHALAPGMILSNEPGYYKAGHYGIRIENLLAVRPWPGEGERDMYEFETLTLAPIDLSLVDAALLHPEEQSWLNAYHARVLDELSPLLDAATKDWLTRATRPI